MYVRNFGGNDFRNNNQYGDTYNPKWRDHPNLSWREQGKKTNYRSKNFQPPSPGFNNNQQNDSNDSSSSLWNTLAIFKANCANRFTKNEVKMQGLGTSLRNLENKVGQLAIASN